MRVVAAMDVAVIRMAEGGQEGVEHLPEIGNRMAIAGDCAMPHFVGEKARVDTQERQRGERKHSDDEARSGKQGGVRGGVATEDECAIHGALCARGPETTGIGEFREQRAVQAIAVRWMFGCRRMDCVSRDGHVDLPSCLRRGEDSCSWRLMTPRGAICS